MLSIIVSIMIMDTGSHNSTLCDLRTRDIKVSCRFLTSKLRDVVNASFLRFRDLVQSWVKNVCMPRTPQSRIDYLHGK